MESNSRAPALQMNGKEKEMVRHIPKNLWQKNPHIKH